MSLGVVLLLGLRRHRPGAQRPARRQGEGGPEPGRRRFRRRARRRPTHRPRLGGRDGAGDERHGRHGTPSTGVTDLRRAARQRRPGRLQRGGAEPRPGSSAASRARPRASGGRGSVRQRSATICGRAVDAGHRRRSRRYAQIKYTARRHRESEPALVVGKRLNDVDGDPYQLYYLFPLDQEEQTLNLVKGTLATAGLFVVVLLGAIAWLVVRQVVTPVRMAAGIAERLSAGRAPGADEGHRRGRHRPARRGLQQDGAEPPAEDPAAGGAVADAAALRLRRLARAADAADDGADGRRRHP